MGPDDEAFRAVVQSCISAGNARIILDCSGLEIIDSAGLDTLAFSRQSFDGSRQNRFAEHGANSYGTLPLAKLDVLFEVFTDEQNAANSFFRSAPSCIGMF